MKILHSLAAGLLSATSIFARRVAFPLLFLGAGLVLVQPCAGGSGVFNKTGSLATARLYHTATLLPNGKVLVAGGFSSGGSLASAELYDPASGTWATTGSLANARYVHTGTLTQTGKVLVAGGSNQASGFLASAELFDPGPPLIISPLNATGTAGQLFIYQFEASGATSLGVSNLPPGLTFNASLRAIIGTPSATGIFQVGLSASNTGGTTRACHAL